MKYIGIDIGSSYIKSAVLDTKKLQTSNIIRQKAPGKLIGTGLGYHETDPGSILISVKDMIEQQLKKTGEINGILISTQMHGFILSDAGGMAVTPYISWQDTRCLELYKTGNTTYMEQLQEKIGYEDIKKTGIRLKPGLAACSLFHWMENNQTGLLEKRPLHFCTLGSYLILKLTGKNACHMTNAAATGFIDITRNMWNRNILHAVGCDMLEFPEIMGEDRICGFYKGIAVYPDIGDHQATVLGTEAEKEGSAVITSGTAGIVCRITKDRGYGEYEIRPFFDDYVLRTVTRLPGGRNLDVLVDFIADVGKTVFDAAIDKKNIWNKILSSVECDEKESLFVELGFLKGQVGVVHGRIDGINAENLAVGALFKGAFTNLAKVYSSAMVQVFDSLSGIENIVLSGGVFSENEFIKTAIEKISGKKAVLSAVREEALNGLLKIAVKIDGKDGHTAAHTAQRGTACE